MTGDELFSDIYPMRFIGENQSIIELKGKTKTESNDFDDSAIGANPSAEEAAEGADAASVTGVDIVLANRLQEVSAYSLKEYRKKIKEYCSKLVTKKKERIAELESEKRTDEAEKMKEEQEKFKKNFQADLKEIILEPFKAKDFQFFVGESLDEFSMMALVTYPEDDPENRPVMYFIRHGLMEEKV